MAVNIKLSRLSESLPEAVARIPNTADPEDRGWWYEETEYEENPFMEAIIPELETLIRMYDETDSDYPIIHTDLYKMVKAMCSINVHMTNAPWDALGLRDIVTGKSSVLEWTMNEEAEKQDAPRIKQLRELYYNYPNMYRLGEIWAWG